MLFQEAQQLAGLGSWYWDPNAEETYWSPVMLTIYGIGPQEVPRNLDEYLRFVHPDDRPVVVEQVTTARDEGVVITAAYRIVTPAGDVRHLHTTAAGKMLMPDSDVLFGTVQDITDQMQREISLQVARAELQNSLSILASILESGTEGIMLVSVDGVITICNDRFRDMWGLDVDDVKGRPLHDVEALLYAKLLSPDEASVRVAAVGKDPMLVIHDTIELVDGRVFERYSHPQLIDGRPAGRVWKYRDITERHDAEMRAQQAQKMEAVGRLASGIAHDFNNLLGAICNLARFIGDQAGDDGSIKRDVGRIIAACRQGESLTKGLLAYAKRQPVAPRPIPVRKAVDDLSDWLRRALPDSVKLRVEHEGEARAIFIDPFRLSQVIMNLAINGADAMPTGGNLIIRTSGSADEVCIACMDEGAGLEPAIRDRIFDPFFSTKGRASGTGLGLSIVHGVVEQAGGRIEVRGREGGGTIFELRFPAYDEQEEEVRPPLNAPLLQGPTPDRILLVEDDDRLRQVVERILWGAGYQVYSFGDPTAALATAPPADLLVTDVLMPGMSGLELADKLDMPCLLVSGYAADEIDRMPEEQELALLDKPFTRHELLVSIARVWADHLSRNDVVTKRHS